MPYTGHSCFAIPIFLGHGFVSQSPIAMNLSYQSFRVVSNLCLCYLRSRYDNQQEEAKRVAGNTIVENLLDDRHISPTAFKAFCNFIGEVGVEITNLLTICPKDGNRIRIVGIVRFVPNLQEFSGPTSANNLLPVATVFVLVGDSDYSCMEIAYRVMLLFNVFNFFKRRNR